MKLGVRTRRPSLFYGSAFPLWACLPTSKIGHYREWIDIFTIQQYTHVWNVHNRHMYQEPLKKKTQGEKMEGKLGRRYSTAINLRKYISSVIRKMQTTINHHH